MHIITKLIQPQPVGPKLLDILGTHNMQRNSA